MPIAPLSQETKAKVEEILKRATEDVAFREELIANPDTALSNSDLSDDEKKLVGSLRRVKLEEWGVDVKHYRMVLRDNGNKMSSGG